MGLFGNKQTLGIDIGSATTKAVAVRIENKQPVMVTADTFDTGAEGILNENELFASVAGWLREAPWAQGTQTAGLPQYLVTTQITDFPPGVRNGLENMVRYETQQLAGLSDESFVHDFHILSPGHGRRNPVLIGLCRESVVRERLSALANAGLHPTSIGMNGLAALNALLYLHPEAAEPKEQPQLLLDIGLDATTIAIFIADQPLYTGTLDFGSHMLTEALLERAGGDEGKAEARKRELDVEDLAPGSPARDLLRRLDSEIANALDHWRDQQPGDLADEGVLAFWLCGGGAQQNGLTAYLTDRHECAVHRFGPPDPASPDDPMTEYATALGLALLGVGSVTIPLCLMPDEAKWAQKRRRRLPWAIAAAVLATLAIAALIASSYVRSRRTLTALLALDKELSTCRGHISRLRDMQAGILAYESQVAPLVEEGNRSRRVLRALDDLANVCEPNSWFVYLGDDFSYEAGKLTDEEKRKRRARAGKPKARGAFTVATDESDNPIEFPERIQALDVPQMRALIGAGYTPFTMDDPGGYAAVARLRAKLSELKPYSGVDAISTDSKRGREDIFMPWDTFRERHLDTRYSQFVVRLPFSSLPLAIPEPEPVKEKK